MGIGIYFTLPDFFFSILLKVDVQHGEDVYVRRWEVLFHFVATGLGGFQTTAAELPPRALCNPANVCARNAMKQRRNYNVKTHRFRYTIGPGSNVVEAKKKKITPMTHFTIRNVGDGK